MTRRAGGPAAGLVAGAAGTTALNLASYLDMVLRGRPSSSVPAETAGRLAEAAGIDLGSSAGNRRSGLGGVLGHLSGLAIGAGYGMLRRIGVRLPWPVAAVALGAGAMAASDVPAAAAGATDPQTWSRSAWLSDAVPHLAYGAVTALSFEAAARPH